MLELKLGFCLQSVTGCYGILNLSNMIKVNEADYI